LKRGPGRPPNALKRGLGTPRKIVGVAGSIEGFVAALRENDREREKFVRVLEQIRAIIEQVG
jgi:hypothetical protein